MASKAYCQKYRNLKSIYIRAYGKEISDISWYRLTSQLKQLLDFSVDKSNAELIIRSIANLKRAHRNFRIDSLHFRECWDIFQHYYQQNKWMTCAEFLADLAKIIDLSLVSRTSRYNWFVNAHIPYRASQKYFTSNLALVAFQAMKCVKSKEMKKIEEANQEIKKIRKVTKS